MKSVPHCTFSSFEKRDTTTFRDKKAVLEDFSGVPNYKLSSKDFDVQHLDRFISRIKVADSINFNPSKSSLSVVDKQFASDDIADKDKIMLIEDDYVVMSKEYTTTRNPAVAGGYASVRVSNKFNRAS